MSFNKVFVEKPFNGNSKASGKNSINFATYSVESHMNVYIRVDGKESMVCLDPVTGKAIALALAKEYGLIPKDTVETRKVVVDAMGNFVRFAEENEE